AEELVEQVAGVVEGVLGGEGHLVAGAAGVGQALAREVVEGLVDGLGLGEAGGGVVEVDHGRLVRVPPYGSNSRTAILPALVSPRIRGTESGTLYSWRCR